MNQYVPVLDLHEAFMRLHDEAFLGVQMCPEPSAIMCRYESR